MHYLICILLLTTGAMARYRRYEYNNLIQRDEPKDFDMSKLVECPVCPHFQYGENEDKCNITINGKVYKSCKYGIFRNKQCDGNPDCIRGPNEVCFNNKVDECAPGYTCMNNKCIGHMTEVDVDAFYKLNPTVWSKKDDKRRPNSDPLLKDLINFLYILASSNHQ